MSDGGQGPTGDGDLPLVTADELDRERLRTYVDWAQVATPWWYWPLYAVVVAAWIAAYDLGGLQGAVGAVCAAAAFGAMIRVVVARSGVSTPRFRGMPGPLLRTFVPLLVVIVLALAAAAAIAIGLDDPSYAAFGVVVGLTLAGTGALSGRWYRRVAARLAREHGLDR